MLCLNCKCEEFKENPDAILEQDYKGLILHIQTPAMVCVQCGWTTVNRFQIDELFQKTKAEYEKRIALKLSIDNQDGNGTVTT